MKYLFVVLALTFSIFAYGADSLPPEALEIPAWVGGVLAMLSSLPYVGPALLFVVKWAVLASAIMTALSTAAMAILGALKGVSQWAGFDKFQSVLLWVEAKVMPVLKYISMYNAQKKQ